MPDLWHVAPLRVIGHPQCYGPCSNVHTLSKCYLRRTSHYPKVVRSLILKHVFVSVSSKLPPACMVPLSGSCSKVYRSCGEIWVWSGLLLQDTVEHGLLCNEGWRRMFTHKTRLRRVNTCRRRLNDAFGFKTYWNVNLSLFIKVSGTSLFMHRRVIKINRFSKGKRCSNALMIP